MIPPDVLATAHAACFAAPRAWSAADFAGTLASPGVVLLGDRHAFLLGRVIAGEAEVLTIATAPRVQRQGRARALLADFIDRARALGATTLFLEVAADNAAAQALYGGAGLTVTGRRRAYYRNATGNPTDALVMSVRL